MGLRYRQSGSDRLENGQLTSGKVPAISGKGHELMITVSHPQVNQYVRALLAGLQKNHALYEFYTTLSVGRRRIDIPGINPKVRQFPCREVARLIAQRLGQEWLTRHNSG